MRRRFARCASEPGAPSGTVSRGQLFSTARPTSTRRRQPKNLIKSRRTERQRAGRRRGRRRAGAGAGRPSWQQEGRSPAQRPDERIWPPAISSHRRRRRRRRRVPVRPAALRSVAGTSVRRALCQLAAAPLEMEGLDPRPPLPSDGRWGHADDPIIGCVSAGQSRRIAVSASGSAGAAETFPARTSVPPPPTPLAADTDDTLSARVFLRRYLSETTGGVLSGPPAGRRAASRLGRPSGRPASSRVLVAAPSRAPGGSCGRHSAPAGRGAPCRQSRTRSRSRSWSRAGLQCSSPAPPPPPRPRPGAATGSTGRLKWPISGRRQKTAPND